MINKKAFTLIEILAVIVLLAIVSLISVPLITGVLESAKLSAFENSLNKLDFSFGDFMDFVLAGFGAVGAYFALVNIWNPLGWIAAGLTILGWLFGGRDKVAQAKEKMRNNINEAKKKNRTTYNEQISRIQNNLDNTCQQIVMSVDSDLQNIRCLHNFIKDIEGKIQLEYSKLKIKDYGCI